MDNRRFDELVRSVASGLARRSALKAAVAGVFVALGQREVSAGQVTQAHCGNVTCKSNLGTCKAGCVCCVYPNGNSRCRPPGNCASGGEERYPSDQVVYPIHGCVTPAPTTSTTTSSTTLAPTTIATTTARTAAPVCPDGATDCNGACCPSPCQCLQRLDGGLSCVNATQGRGCSGPEAGRCDDGFACVAGVCRGICDASATATTTTTSEPCQPLGSNGFFGSDRCCQQPEPSMCRHVFDGGQADPAVWCCRPSGGYCFSFVDCCDGVPCTGGKYST